MRKILPILVLFFLPAIVKGQAVVPLFADTLICLGSNTIKLPYGTLGSFSGGNVFTAQLSNASGSFTSAVNIGTDTSTVSDTIVCIVPGTTTAGNGYRIRIVASNPSVMSADNGVNIRVSPSPEFSLDSQFHVCTGRNLQLIVTAIDSTLNYLWSGPYGYSSTTKSPIIDSPSIFHQGSYTVVASKEGCSTSKKTWLNITTTSRAPHVSGNTSICSGDSIKIRANSTVVDDYSIVVGPNYFSITNGPHEFLPSFADTGVYMAYVNNANCLTDTTYFRVAINQLFVPTVLIWPTPGKSVGPYTQVTFHSLVYNNYKPKFQWYVNGSAVAGATDTVFTIQKFSTGDKVHLMVLSDTTCTQTVSSDTVTLEVNLGVPENYAPGKLSLFPNPHNGRFSLHVNGVGSGAAAMEIFSTIGQCILRTTSELDNGSLENVDITSYPAGIYHIRLTTENEQFRGTFRKE
jgi:hypothetical protein